MRKLSEIMSIECLEWPFEPVSLSSPIGDVLEILEMVFPLDTIVTMAIGDDTPDELTNWC
jgi:hypothetical protein